MTFELVAFDCDGVLVDTEPEVNRVFVELVGETGPTLDVAETLARFNGVALLPRIDAVRRDHAWTPPEGFYEVFERRLLEAVRKDVKPVSGVRSVLERLTGPRCVVSNGTRAEMNVKLSQTGLLAYFAPHLFTATELAHPKPHPDVYLHATARMGVAPAAAAAVEDSEPGVTAAVAAGLTVFGYAAYSNADNLRRLGATAVFRNMTELPALLGLPPS